MTVVTEKPCARCKRTLQASAFDPNPKLKSGLHTYCKPCRKEKNAERPKNSRKSDTVKSCTACERTLPADCFMSNVNNSDGLRSRCKDCTSSQQTLRKFNLTADQYAELAKNGCRICGSHDRLHVDHDHSCCSGASSGSARFCGKCVRGILCRTCNIGLGMFHDNPELLLGAVEYLRHNGHQPV